MNDKKKGEYTCVSEYQWLLFSNHLCGDVSDANNQ